MKRILIVDDSRVFQRIMEQTLSTQYQIVGKANNGDEGFNLFKQLNPDLVLLDIVMPDCNGKQCLEMIMKYDSNASVIMVSSVGDDKTINDCLQLGAKAFICKEEISRILNPGESKLIQAVDQIFSYTGQSEAAWKLTLD